MSKPKLSIFCVVALALLVVPVTAAEAQTKPQQQPQGPGQEEERAITDILLSSDPTQTLTLVEKFLTTYPSSQFHGHAYMAASQAHRLQNNFDKAIEYGERAMELNPNNAIAMILVAYAFSEGARADQPNYKERLKKAEDYSRRALNLLPEFFASIPHNPDIPEEKYKLQENHIEAQAHATLGFVHFRRNELAAAEEELTKATELNEFRPNPADFERLGLVQVQQEKYDQARASFQRCIEIGGLPAEVCQRRLELLEQLVEQERRKQQPNP